jgi:hypothetical protein
MSNEECGAHRAGALAEVEAVRTAHLACVVESDCAEISVSTTCNAQCPTVVAAEGASAVQDAVTRANQDICEDVNSGGCPETPSVSCMMFQGIACDQGVCTAVY